MFIFFEPMSTINLKINQGEIAAFGIWFIEKNATKAFKILKSRSPENCPDERKIQRWSKQSQDGKFRFGHKSRPVRPFTVASELGVHLIEDNLYDEKVTIEKLSVKAGGELSSVKYYRAQIKSIEAPLASESA